MSEFAPAPRPSPPTLRATTPTGEDRTSKAKGNLATQQRRLDGFVGGGHELDPELITTPEEASRGGALAPRPGATSRSASPRRREARRLHRGTGKNERQHSQTMLFEPEEIAVDAHVPSQNKGGDTEIGDFVADFMSALRAVGTFFQQGLQQFTLKMMFGESQAEESSALANLLGGLLRGALDKVIAPIPGLPEVMALISEAREHLASATASTPASSNARLADWLAMVGGQVVLAHERFMLRAAPRLREALRERFAQEDGQAAPELIVGAKARLIKSLEVQREAMLARAEALTPAYYLDRITAVWIRSPGAGGGGSSKTKGSLGPLSNGCIRVWVDAAQNDLVEGAVFGKGLNSFTVTRASLHTTSHQGQAATLVKEALKAGRKTLWSFGVPVKVMVKLPNTMPGGKSWHQCDFARPGEPLGAAPSSERAASLWAAFLRDTKVWDQMTGFAATRLEGNV